MLKTVIIFLVFINCLVFNNIVFSQGLLPLVILGSVTNNGIPAQFGQILYIMTNDTIIAKTYIDKSGRFGPINIQEPDIKNINFKLDNEHINEIYIWKSGEVYDLILTVNILDNTSPTPPPPPPPQTNEIFLTPVLITPIPLIGAQGEDGVQGLAGKQGSRGLDGAQGPQGIRGIQGVPGISGELGVIGEQGDQGEQGESGIKGQSNKLISGFGILIGLISIIIALYIYRDVKNIS